MCVDVDGPGVKRSMGDTGLAVFINAFTARTEYGIQPASTSTVHVECGLPDCTGLTGFLGRGDCAHNVLGRPAEYSSVSSFAQA